MFFKNWEKRKGIPRREKLVPSRSHNVYTKVFRKAGSERCRQVLRTMTGEVGSFENMVKSMDIIL